MPRSASCRSGRGGVRGEEDGKQEQQACNLIVKGERKKSLGEGRRRREQRNREPYEGRGEVQQGGQQMYTESGGEEEGWAAEGKGGVRKTEMEG